MDKQIEELLPLYALSGLSAEEEAAMEAYLINNVESQIVLEKMMATVEQLPYGVSAVSPSPHVKSRLMARVRQNVLQEQARQKQIQPSWGERLWQIFRWGWGMPALTTLTTVTLFFTLLWVQSLWRDNQTLRQELLTQQTLIAQLEENSQVANLLHNPQHIATIAGTEHRPQAVAQLITDQKATQAILIVDHLANLDTQSIYQLWLIEGQTPHPAGLFTVSLQGNGVWLIDSEMPITSFDAIGVSIEPATGSQQPTGDIILLGTLSTG